jgi:hypothetical protein
MCGSWGLEVSTSSPGSCSTSGSTAASYFGLNGLTGPARKRAEGASQPKISIGDLVATEDHIEPDLSRLLTPKFGDCPNENCVTGDVGWRWWESRSGRIRAGSCDICGTWAVECPECTDVLDYFGEEALCYSCGTLSATLVNDRDNIGPVGIVIRRGIEEETFEATNKSAFRGPRRRRTG